MPVPFGFSVGDFVAVIELISTIINALEDSRGSAADYRGTIASLESLRTALQGVCDIDCPDECQKHALRKVADESAQAMVGFLSAIVKYQPSLRQGDSSRKWKDVARKIQWSLHGNREDARRFQVQIQAHATALQVIMTRIQITNESAATRQTSQALTRLESKLDQQRIIQTMIFQALARCWTDCRALMAMILYANIKIFDTLTGPTFRSPQVQFGKPVTLQDAHGRFFPFHLQLVDSWDFFEEMLRRKFVDVPGLRKIELGEYALQDKWDSRDLVRTKPFHSCFRPGNHVDMSVIFYQQHDSRGACPKCENLNQLALDQDIVCSRCELTYRVSVVQDAVKFPETSKGAIRGITKKRLSFISTETQSSRSSIHPPIPAMEQVSDFNRVRIENRMPIIAKMFPGAESTADPKPAESSPGQDTSVEPASSGGEGGDAGGNAFDFSVDPSMDPELALALRMSYEEEKARQKKEKKATEAAEGKTATVPVLLEWKGHAKRVFVTGTFLGWEKKYRLYPRGSGSENVFSGTFNISRGVHHLQFIVDGEMQVSDNLHTAVDYTNTLVNYIEVDNASMDQRLRPFLSESRVEELGILPGNEDNNENEDPMNLTDDQLDWYEALGGNTSEEGSQQHEFLGPDQSTLEDKVPVSHMSPPIPRATWRKDPSIGAPFPILPSIRSVSTGQSGIPPALQRVILHLDPTAPIRLQPSPEYYPPPPDGATDASRQRRRGSRAGSQARQKHATPIRPPTPLSPRPISAARFDFGDRSISPNYFRTQSNPDSDEGDDLQSDDGSDPLSLSLSSELSTTAVVGDDIGTICTCERYGITRSGERVKLDCGGVRCGHQ